MTKQALLLVDIQNDYFPTGKWPLVGIQPAAHQAAKVLAAFRERGDTVIHVRHEFTSQAAPFFTPDSEGAHIHSSVANQPGEAVVLKHFVNSFRDTQLKSLLEQQGISSLVVVGHMSHMCVDAAVRAAADLGFNVTVLHDACATLDLEFNGVQVPAAQVHAAYMASLAFAYAEVISTAEYLDR